MNDRRHGYRGYIGSRSYFGNRTPQHVQNLVIRDHCTRRGLEFLLSATEYTMPGCFIMLEQVLKELDVLEGLIVYSLFMLPREPNRRRTICDRVIVAGAAMHFAVEGIVLSNREDIREIERMWLIHECVFDGNKDTVDTLRTLKPTWNGARP